MTGVVRHASSLVIGEMGVLIEGPSGSGKSSVMFGLVERAKLAGLDAAIISDDQTILTPKEDGLWLSAPEQIAGKAELRGFGIIDVQTAAGAWAKILGILVPAVNVERMPEPATSDLFGIKINVVKLPMNHEEAAARIVLACLSAYQTQSLRFPSG